MSTVSARAGLIRAACDAAGDVADLKREADRIDPYVPLAAWHAPLRALDRTLASASNGLYHAAKLASDVIGQDPAMPMPGAVPGALAVASTRASAASDHVGGGTAAAVLRELRRTGTEQEPDPTPLRRQLAYAASSLGKLDDALLAAVRTAAPDPGMLAAIAAVAQQQSQILAGLSGTCERFHYGVAEACERLPGATRGKSTRISAPLRRASVTLTKASAGTAHAATDLDGGLARSRRRGDPR